MAQQRVGFAQAKDSNRRAIGSAVRDYVDDDSSMQAINDVYDEDDDD